MRIVQLPILTRRQRPMLQNKEYLRYRARCLHCDWKADWTYLRRWLAAQVGDHLRDAGHTQYVATVNGATLQNQAQWHG